MPLRIRNPQDLWCGLLFIALGVLAVYLSRNYVMGTALEMGPGYFPTWLGYIMMGFGVVIGAMAFRLEGDPDRESLAWRTWAFRPWLVTTAAIAVYAWMMDAEAGFVPSLFVLVVGSSLAHKDVRWIETLVLAACVTAGAVGIFILGIGLPYKLFWWSN